MKHTLPNDIARCDGEWAEDGVNAVLSRLESEHPALVAKLKEVLA